MQDTAENLVHNHMKEYTSYVSKSRVLPFLDGLKPVFRRLLYSMMKVKAKDRMLKSSNILGETIKLHPHGGASVYGAAQTIVCSPNSLIEGKGNWGNGIYSPIMAAERYTEAKLSPIFEELIDPYFEKLGEFIPSYDETLIEPRIMEFRLPVAELLGVSGIGVALVTRCPALHIDTVIDKTLSVLDNREVNHKYAYGSWEYKNRIIPEYEIEEKDGKGWLVIKSIPNSRYLDFINEDSVIRELCASGQLIIDDKSQKVKKIVQYRVHGSLDILNFVIKKLSFRPVNNLFYYDTRIRNTGYYESWVAHRLEYISRLLSYQQILLVNKALISNTLSEIHNQLEIQNVKGRDGFLQLVESVGYDYFDKYEKFISPYKEQCNEWVREKSEFILSLKSTALSSLKHNDFVEYTWNEVTKEQCQEYLISDINKINRKLFSPASKKVTSIPELPEDVKVTRYITLRGNQVEVRFKRIPRMTNWTTEGKIIILYEDGTQKELADNYFGLFDDSNKKVVGFTFPNTVTIFVTDTQIHAYVRFGKVTEIIKTAFPCKKIKINGKDYKVTGGKSWDMGNWSVVEP